MQHHAKLRSLHHCQATDWQAILWLVLHSGCLWDTVFINVVCCRALNRWITWICCEVDQMEEGLVDTWIDGWVWKRMKEKPETSVGAGWASDLHRTRPRPVTSTREGLSQRSLWEQAEAAVFAGPGSGQRPPQKQSRDRDTCHSRPKPATFTGIG